MDCLHPYLSLPPAFPDAHERDPAIHFVLMQSAHVAMIKGRFPAGGLTADRFSGEGRGTELGPTANPAVPYLKGVIEP